MSGVNWRVIDRAAKQTLEMPLERTKLKPRSSVVCLDDTRCRSEIAIENKNWGERPGNVEEYMFDMQMNVGERCKNVLSNQIMPSYAKIIPIRLQFPCWRTVQ